MRNLTDREKFLLKILIIFLSVLFLYYVIIIPLHNIISNGTNYIAENKYKLQQLDNIYIKYRELDKKLKKYNSLLNNKSENVSALIDSFITKSNLNGKIAYARRSQSNIQNRYLKITTNMKIESAPIQSILKLIYEIENSRKLLKINYLRIQKSYKSDNLYDVYLKIDYFSSK